MRELIPTIYVKDIDKTIDFYTQLGFVVIYSMTGDNILREVVMVCGKVRFIFRTHHGLDAKLPIITSQSGGSLLFYIEKPEVRKFYEEMKNKVKVVKYLRTTFFGMTEFSIEDNNGFMLTFAEAENPNES